MLLLWCKLLLSTRGFPPRIHRFLPLVKRAKAGHGSTCELVYEKVHKTQEQRQNQRNGVKIVWKGIQNKEF